MRRELRAGLWWGMALGIMLATAAWIGDSALGPPGFDHEGLLLANAWRSPWLDAAFRALTWLGSRLLLLPLAVLVAGALWRRGHRAEAGFVIVAMAGAALLAELAKQWAMRPRPELFPALAAVASPLSFPSAHALQATTLALCGALLVGRLAPGYRWPALALLASIAVLVGISRLYLQVHYPSDVLAGTAVAGCWVAGLRVLMLRAGAAVERLPGKQGA